MEEVYSVGVQGCSAGDSGRIRRDDLIGSLERIRRASHLRGVRGRLDEEFARVDGNLLCWVNTLLESVVDPTDRSIGFTGHENFGEMRQVRLLI